MRWWKWNHARLVHVDAVPMWDGTTEIRMSWTPRGVKKFGRFVEVDSGRRG